MFYGIHLKGISQVVLISVVCNMYFTITFCNYCHISPHLATMYDNYSDVIISAMTSQITSVSTVCSIVCSDADKKNIKAPRHWPFSGESPDNRRIPLIKGQSRRKCFQDSGFRNFLFNMKYIIKFYRPLYVSISIKMMRHRLVDCQIKHKYSTSMFGDLH